VSLPPPSLFNELVNALLELRSVATGTSLDQGQWQSLQQHLETAGAAALAAAEGERQAGAAQGPEPGAQAPQLAQQLFDDGLGLPTSARHARGGATHRRTSSIVASLRIGHIPAGSTDAGEGQLRWRWWQLRLLGVLGLAEVVSVTPGWPLEPPRADAARSRAPPPPLRPPAAACTLNGTRSAFTAAMHVALGDACPLDVLRVDMGE
jgi:hypothetical protein